MRIYLTALALIATLLVGCSAPVETPEMIASPTASPTAASTANDVVPVPTTTAEPAVMELPGDFALEPIGDSGVSGMASFSQLTDTQATISLSIEDNSEFGHAQLGFAALLLRGTCEDRTSEGQAADFDNALDQQNFDAGETPAFVIEGQDLAGIVPLPHVILITDRPGLTNLACGEITPA